MPLLIVRRYATPSNTLRCWRSIRSLAGGPTRADHKGRLDTIQPAWRGVAPALFERRDCRRRDHRQGVNRRRSLTAAQLTELRGSHPLRRRGRFSTPADRSAGSNGVGAVALACS
jgi:hypothetical protein